MGVVSLAVGLVVVVLERGVREWEGRRYRLFRICRVRLARSMGDMTVLALSSGSRGALVLEGSV